MLFNFHYEFCLTNDELKSQSLPSFRVISCKIAQWNYDSCVYPNTVNPRINAGVLISFLSLKRRLLFNQVSYSSRAII